MRQSPQAETERKTSLLATLSTGFDITTHHIWIIILPLVLDVFYWIGPRLSIEKLIEESAAILKEQPAFAEMADQMLQIGSQYNFFTSLSIPIIGIPALMGGTVPEHIPVNPAVVQIEDSFIWMLLFLGLSLLGLVFSTLYFQLISYVLQEPKVDYRSNIGSNIKRLVVSYIRLIGLGIVFVFMLMALWLPLLSVAFLAGIVSSSLFYLVVILGLAISLSIVAYLSLTIPAIVFANRTVNEAIRESVRLVHKNLSSVLGLLLVVVLVGSVTRLLWHLADNGSWMTLISIAGNAFISTALVMAIFIYYRDHEVHQPQGLS
ncbi:MAG TPA: hypothetical protein VMZ24_00410 [Patescibacteria group bacterium]|jgi:hypothetical protein|nr:hypothetical protein [Patescibacteria group bacterium]